MTNYSNNRRGSILVVIAVTLVVAGILAMTMLTPKSESIDNKRQETERRLKVVDRALKAYYLVNSSKYPCPASRAVLAGNALYGAVTACANDTAATCETGIDCLGADASLVVRGAAPVRTLGLSDEYMYDAWGNRFIYAVDKYKVPSTTATSNSLSIKTLSGNVLSSSPAYYLGSAGPDGEGAYNGSGTVKTACSGTAFTDGENCDADVNFTDDYWVTGTGSATGVARTFDDITVNEKNYTCPAGIEGCVLWLDGADANTLLDAGGAAADDGEAVERWIDKSRKQANATQSATPSKRPTKAALVDYRNGNSYLLFDATDDALSLNAYITSTKYTIFAVSQRTTNADGKYLWSSNSPTSYEVAASWGRASVVNSAYVSYAAIGNPIGEYLITTTVGAPAADGYSDYYIKGVKATSYYNAASSATNLDRIVSIGAASTGTSGYFDGKVMEIIAYPTKLSETSRKKVECYLSSKWAITVPHCKTPDNTITGSCPAGVSGCKVWLDASDTSTVRTVNGATPAAVGNTSDIVRWYDKSGEKNDAYAIIEPVSNVRPVYHPTARNSLGGLKFSSMGMQLSALLRTATEALSYTIFTVTNHSDDDADGSTMYANYRQAGTSGGEASSASRRTYFYSFPNFVSNDATRYARGEYVIGTSWGRTLAEGYSKYFVNGVEFTNYKNVVASASNYITSLGSNYIGNAALLKGHYLEFIAYPSALPEANKKAVECYLATKWNIYVPHCTLAVAAPAVGSCPAGVTGCKIWFDAADISTLVKPDGTAVTTVGDEIGTWYDKSGSNNHTYALWSGKRPLYDGATGVLFYSGGTGRHMTYSALIDNTEYTTISAVDAANSGTGSYMWYTSNPQYGMAWEYFSPGKRTSAAVPSSQSISSKLFTTFSPAILNTDDTISSIVAKTNARYYVNGQDATTSTTITPLRLGYINYLASMYASTGYSVYSVNGPVKEFVAYDSALSDANRKKVECYIADKWGTCAFLSGGGAAYCGGNGVTYCGATP